MDLLLGELEDWSSRYISESVSICEPLEGMPWGSSILGPQSSFLSCELQHQVPVTVKKETRVWALLACLGRIQQAFNKLNPLLLRIRDVGKVWKWRKMCFSLGVACGYCSCLFL